MTKDTEEFIRDFDERVPDDIHPDDLDDYLRDRYSRNVMDDSTVDMLADRIAERREREGRIPDDPIDVEPSDEPGEGPALGEIEYDPEANRWRHKDTGHFVSDDEI